MRRPFGRTLIAAGDNPEAAAASPARRSGGCKTRAFMLSSLSATVAGILLVGYAGVHPSVGRATSSPRSPPSSSAASLLGGGRGWVLSAAAGAFALELLFTLLTFLGVAVDLAGHRAGRDHHRRRRRRRPRLAVGRRRAAVAAAHSDHRARIHRSHHHARPGHDHRRQLMRSNI